jgi:hypothetical protein
MSRLDTIASAADIDISGFSLRNMVEFKEAIGRQGDAFIRALMAGTHSAVDRKQTMRALREKWRNH